jgi:nicotinamide mononucleotide transporter
MPSPLEIAAVAFTLACVVLAAYENIWSWPTAIIGVSLYFVLFYQQRLYADMGLQLLYLALSVYGWYEWLHGGENHGELRVSYASARVQLAALAGGALLALALGLFLRRTTNAALPFVDATLASYSIVAQLLMTRKYLQNWLLWITVDVGYVGMFTYKHLYLSAALYLVFIAVCTKGWLEWKRSSLEPVAAVA